MMRESTQGITRVCESWWAKLADSTKVEQHTFAAQLLELLGWPAPEPMQVKAPWTRDVSVSYALRGGAQTAIAAHFVMPGTLEPPSSIVERGLDFCEATRILVNGTRSMNIQYTFISDLYRSYLYDANADELLLYADAPAEFDRRFVRVLSRADVERGAIEEVRRQPRSQAARQLREWCQRWCSVLCAEGQLSEESAYLAIDRLIVLGFLYTHNVLRKTRWEFRERFGGIVGMTFSATPKGCGQRLNDLGRDMWRDWKATLFAPNPAIDRVLARDTVAAPFLKEFACLSRTKLTIATVLESFNYGDPSEKARVRMVPDGNKRRETILARQTLDTVDDAHFEIDLKEEGYRALFHWFDRLVGLYDRLDIEFEVQAEQQAPPDEDLDLFAWAEQNATQPGALSDRFLHAAERGVTVFYSTPRQLRTARLLLHLHVISLYHQTKEHFSRFPDIDETLKPRPRVLDSDQRWMHQPAPEEGEHWEEEDTCITAPQPQIPGSL
jgi:hypothetical protein